MSLSLPYSTRFAGRGVGFVSQICRTGCWVRFADLPDGVLGSFRRFAGPVCAAQSGCRIVKEFVARTSSEESIAAPLRRDPPRFLGRETVGRGDPTHGLAVHAFRSTNGESGIAAGIRSSVVDHEVDRACACPQLRRGSRRRGGTSGAWAWSRQPGASAAGCASHDRSATRQCRPAGRRARCPSGSWSRACRGPLASRLNVSTMPVIPFRPTVSVWSTLRATLRFGHSHRPAPIWPLDGGTSRRV